MNIEDDLPPEVEDAGDIDAPVEDALADDTPEAPPSLEDVASRMGWSPKENWRGDPDKWKPAHEFVAATADINGKLSTKLSSMEQRLEVISRTSAAMTEQALARQRQELLEAREEAFQTGDAEAFNKVDAQLARLPQSVETGPPAEVQEWADKNSNWFQKDPEATAWAQNRAGELAKQGLGTQRQLTIVEREARQLFPEFFEADKPKPKPAPLTDTGKRGGGPAKAKTYANLPPEAKAAADDFHKRGRCTRDEYAKTYFEMEG